MDRPFGIIRSPRLRASPFYEATVKAGATAFMPYNHMLLPSLYTTREDEYEALEEEYEARLEEAEEAYERHWEESDAEYAASIIGTWARRYLADESGAAAANLCGWCLTKYQVPIPPWEKPVR